MLDVTFRTFQESDTAACLSMFDANCPQFFAINEREDYQQFLGSVSQGYWICVLRGRIAGAFGILPCDERSMRLNWILLDPQFQGVGVGSRIMRYAMEVVASSEAKTLNIAASQKSCSFFQKFGAIVISSQIDGWGPGMDRIDMELRV